MPYFVYRISPKMQLRCLESFDNYRAARDRVRTRRTEQQESDNAAIRLIHAGSETEAERLLLTPREAPVEGDD